MLIRERQASLKDAQTTIMTDQAKDPSAAQAKVTTPQKWVLPLPGRVLLEGLQKLDRDIQAGF